MEINPKYRNKGIGTYFFNQTASFFKEKGFLAINLYCAPEESENFWKKMDFIKFPDIRFNDSKLKYFKPLIEVQKTALNESKNKIELWDKQPYQIKDNVKPKWVWEINSDTNKPSLPIILPCDYDWNVKWTKEGEVIKESKVKYFSRSNPIRFGEFLYITELFEQKK